MTKSNLIKNFSIYLFIIVCEFTDVSKSNIRNNFWSYKYYKVAMRGYFKCE